MPSRRALNRSLLARQHLLERASLPVAAALEHLVGLQAQVPHQPYVTLWSRLRDFDPLALSALVADGRAVRAGLMRATVHLVTARDHDALQPVMGDVLARTFRSQFLKTMNGAPVDDVVAAGRSLLPATRAELSSALAPAWPDTPKESLGHAVVHHLPLVQTPPRGTWAASGQARWALREPAGDGAPVADIVRRYLAAFGPATPSDIRTWCGLTGLRDVLREMDLVDVDGMLDVPDAPWPDEDTPAPPRFVAEYDNLLLSHADRSRVVGVRVAPPGGHWHGTLLVDGFTCAGWSFAGGRVTIDGTVPPAARDEVDAEATALAAFLSRSA